MSCERYLDLISARLDGELIQQEEADLAAHLRECPACRAIAEDMNGLHSALAAVGEIDAPAQLAQVVMSKIKAERRRSRRRFVRHLSGLAACLVLCVGAWQLARPEPSNVDPGLPGLARHMEPRSVALNRLDAHSLSVTSTDFEPSACLLDSADALARFLAQFPMDDLSAVKDTYTADFFLTHRLLAVVVQEPSSSITHRITELTEDRVTILRDIPQAGDCAMARWLIFAQTELAGPERTLELELIDQ